MSSGLKRQTVALLVLAAFLWLAPATHAAPAQRTFANPDEAVTALVEAARGGKTHELLAILGPGSKTLVFSGDRVADRNGREKFVAAYEAAHKIDESPEGKANLTIGEGSWPFPIPLVKRGEHWAFDAKAGAAEILARRIGENELNVIQVCRAYVDAQRDYASKDRNGDGILEYAQKFVSSKGKEDGLYWPAKAGMEESPLGPLVAAARAEGYGGKAAHGKRQPYHGYYYRILTAQGPDAPGGAYSYMADGRMIGGFALVAYPARWGVSGIMTFIVNQDGIVHEKNLGRDTAAIASRMTEYDPDPSWKTP
jgi:hypothetical protein